MFAKQCVIHHTPFPDSGRRVDLVRERIPSYAAFPWGSPCRRLPPGLLHGDRGTIMSATTPEVRGQRAERAYEERPVRALRTTETKPSFRPASSSRTSRCSQGSSSRARSPRPAHTATTCSAGRGRADAAGLARQCALVDWRYCASGPLSERVAGAPTRPRSEARPSASASAQRPTWRGCAPVCGPHVRGSAG